MRQNRFEDIPLPGFVLDSSAQTVPLSRPYDPTLPPTEAAISAFWSKVVKAPGEGCWIWTAAIASGYGRISWRTDGISRTEYAHRFALLIAGQLPDGVIGEHRCNEPLCVRAMPSRAVEPEHYVGQISTPIVTHGHSLYATPSRMDGTRLLMPKQAAPPFPATLPHCSKVVYSRHN